MVGRGVFPMVVNNDLLAVLAKGLGPIKRALVNCVRGFFHPSLFLPRLRTFFLSLSCIIHRRRHCRYRASSTRMYREELSRADPSSRDTWHIVSLEEYEKSAGVSHKWSIIADESTVNKR